MISRRKPGAWLLGITALLGASWAIAAVPVVSPPKAADAEEPHAKISLGQSAILGVVEGLTEYLPVSSTGHLILASHAMGLSHLSPDKKGPFGPMIEKDPGLDAFEIVIQLGAILAVLGLYRKRVKQMIMGLVGKDAAGLHLLIALLIAFLPAAIIGMLAHKKIEEYLFNPAAVAWSLAVGGVLMIVVEHFFWRRKRNIRRTTQVDRVMIWQALVIGCAECLAMWPGTSRSMVTILAALVVGLDMGAAAEFSFLLALPTLGGATVFEGFKYRHQLLHAAGPAGLAVGLVVSAIVAAFAVKGFVKWLTRHGLAPFGVYRIALAAAVLAYFASH